MKATHEERIVHVVEVKKVPEILTNVRLDGSILYRVEPIRKIRSPVHTEFAIKTCDHSLNLTRPEKHY